jgi:hypothetical protein
MMDSSLVLMAHLRFPAHIGVWLKPEARIIHCRRLAQSAYDHRL